LDKIQTLQIMRHVEVSRKHGSEFSRPTNRLQSSSWDLNWTILEATCLSLEAPSLQFLQLEDKGLFNILFPYVTKS